MTGLLKRFACRSVEAWMARPDLAVHKSLSWASVIPIRCYCAPCVLRSRLRFVVAVPVPFSPTTSMLIPSASLVYLIRYQLNRRRLFRVHGHPNTCKSFISGHDIISRVSDRRARGHTAVIKKVTRLSA